MTPIVYRDIVICECGGRMAPWNYIAFPSFDRWILWRCTEGHVTHALPLPKEDPRVRDDID